MAKTKVTIEFTINSEIYKEYEEALQNFQNSLPEVDMDVKEVDPVKEGNEIYKGTVCEVSELFYTSNISDEGDKRQTFNYRELLEVPNRPIYSHIKEQYPFKLQLLKNGDVDFIEIFYI